MKKNIIFVSILSVIIFLTACSKKTTSVPSSTESVPPSAASESSPAASEPPPAASETPSSEESSIILDQEDTVFTLEELAAYNGENGMPAYVAVDGIVYDVTDIPQWAGGNHNGLKAGNDLTDEIKNISPHGLSVLDRLTQVGTLEG